MTQLGGGNGAELSLYHYNSITKCSLRHRHYCCAWGREPSIVNPEKDANKQTTVSRENIPGAPPMVECQLVFKCKSYKREQV